MLGNAKWVIPKRFKRRLSGSGNFSHVRRFQALDSGGKSDDLTYNF